uniref:LisH domain-containing protein n=1 Tax=Leptocylindrus danicus TaxID=163516 RepID=A0A7S2LLX0_9STRA|mmetsp:Transcript_6822/g.10144  ORF Transcript_6822/g.10144 Transcript_6822/m.10144 type:complete len:1102 (+) Transcript_6822:283-3588(+)|eukprot:CAMPEP_0116006000 /NCGR_PEP_ID=MMETSP0321-20121206/1478_1 /TAXON_ID=163516 /ORGANISM="Leptocylindrus danicus var. danicus, Strain B650" /LENGTH=1101 /DNA_ID=CAMNT_0003474491 /DNA_START=280 /DNA_END=3582 /DNA_ORIENTATION=-
MPGSHCLNESKIDPSEDLISLKQALQSDLRRSGLVGCILLQFRSYIARKLVGGIAHPLLRNASDQMPTAVGATPLSTPFTDKEEAIRTLIFCYLRDAGLKCTTSVFAPEAGIRSEIMSVKECILALGIQFRTTAYDNALDSWNHQSSAYAFESKPLVKSMLVWFVQIAVDRFSSMNSSSSVSTQTEILDPVESARSSLNFELGRLKEKYNKDVDEESAMQGKHIEECIRTFQATCETRLERDFQEKVKRFRQREVSKIHLEEEKRFKLELRVVKAELKAEYESRLQVALSNLEKSRQEMCDQQQGEVIDRTIAIQSLECRERKIRADEKRLRIMLSQAEIKMKEAEATEMKASKLASQEFERSRMQARKSYDSAMETLDSQRKLLDEDIVKLKAEMALFDDKKSEIRELRKNLAALEGELSQTKIKLSQADLELQAYKKAYGENDEGAAMKNIRLIKENRSLQMNLNELREARDADYVDLQGKEEESRQKLRCYKNIISTLKFDLTNAENRATAADHEVERCNDNMNAAVAEAGNLRLLLKKSQVALEAIRSSEVRRQRNLPALKNLVPSNLIDEDRSIIRSRSSNSKNLPFEIIYRPNLPNQMTSSQNLRKVSSDHACQPIEGVKLLYGCTHSCNVADEFTGNVDYIDTRVLENVSPLTHNHTVSKSHLLQSLASLSITKPPPDKCVSSLRSDEVARQEVSRDAQSGATAIMVGEVMSNEVKVEDEEDLGGGDDEGQEEVLDFQHAISTAVINDNEGSEAQQQLQVVVAGANHNNIDDGNNKAGDEEQIVVLDPPRAAAADVDASFFNVTSQEQIIEDEIMGDVNFTAKDIRAANEGNKNPVVLQGASSDNNVRGHEPDEEMPLPEDSSTHDFPVSDKLEMALEPSGTSIAHEDKNATSGKQTPSMQIIIKTSSQGTFSDAEKRNDDCVKLADNVGHYPPERNDTIGIGPGINTRKLQEEVVNADNEPSMAIEEASIKGNERTEDLEKNGIVSRELEEFSSGSGIYDYDFHENESDFDDGARLPNDIQCDDSVKTSKSSSEFKYMSHRLVEADVESISLDQVSIERSSSCSNSIHADLTGSSYELASFDTNFRSKCSDEW